MPLESSMPSSKPKSAEANFREAFERLKAAVPQILPPGTPVSQNNVAKEAGCDPTALKKLRYPNLVAEIQAYVDTHGKERPPSGRQRLLKARQVSRSKSETIAHLKAQRDAAASLLVEANAQIGVLTRRARDLETKLDDLQPRASIVQMPSAKPRATRKPWTSET